MKYCPLKFQQDGEDVGKNSIMKQRKNRMKKKEV